MSLSLAPCNIHLTEQGLVFGQASGSKEQQNVSENPPAVFGTSQQRTDCNLERGGGACSACFCWFAKMFRPEREEHVVTPFDMGLSFLLSACGLILHITYIPPVQRYCIFLKLGPYCR